MQAAQVQASSDSEDEVRENGGEKTQDGQRERDGNTKSGKRTFSGGKEQQTLKVRVPSLWQLFSTEGPRQASTNREPTKSEESNRAKRGNHQPPEPQQETEKQGGEWGRRGMYLWSRYTSPLHLQFFSIWYEYSAPIGCACRAQIQHPRLWKGFQVSQIGYTLELQDSGKSYQCNVKTNPQEMRWMKQTLSLEVGQPGVVGRRAQDCKLKNTSRRHRIQMRTVGENCTRKYCQPRCVRWEQ